MPEQTFFIFSQSTFTISSEGKLYIQTGDMQGSEGEEGRFRVLIHHYAHATDPSISETVKLG